MPAKYQDERVPSSNYAVIRWFGFDQFVPERAVTSYWITSKLLLTIRFILAFYSAIVFWTYLGLVAVYAPRFDKFFSMFTTFTFIGLHAYLVTSCVHQFRYLHSKSIEFLRNQPAVLNYLYLYLYATVVTFNILTPVVFWSIISRNGSASFPPAAVWINVSVHGVSFFLMLIDVILSRIKLPVRLVLFVFFTAVFYMFLTFIIFGSTGKWVYSFLDWNQGPKTALWYFVVAIIVVVAYFIMVLIHWIRDWIAFKLGKNPAMYSTMVQSEGHKAQTDRGQPITEVSHTAY